MKLKQLSTRKSNSDHSLFIIALGILGLAFILYWPVFNYSLVYLDDNIWCFRGQWFLKNPQHWLDMLTRPDFVSKNFFRPMTNISFFLDTQIGGGGMWMYRLTNIFLHALSAVAVFLCLDQMGYVPRRAAAAALVFTAHPLLQQAVAWIPGRTDTLPAVFILFSFLLWIKWVDRRRWTDLAGHWLFASLAFLCKETMIFFPAVCAAWVWAKRVRINSKEWGLWTLGWLCLISGWLLWRSLIMAQSGGSLREQIGMNVPLMSPAGLMSLATLAVKSAPLILVYWGKIFWPSPLAAIFTMKTQALAVGIWSAGAVVLLLAFSRFKDNRKVLFGLWWFFIFLVPSAMLGVLKHEYRVYIPMVGVLMIVLECDLLKPGSKFKETILLAALAGIILSLGWWGLRNLERFKNKEIFWTHAVADAPDYSFVHCQRSLVFYYHKDFNNMEKELRRALALDPTENEVHANLGLLYLANYHPDLAEEEFLRELKFHPKNAFACFMMGHVLEYQGQWTQTIQWWEKTLAIDPLFVPASRGLVTIYLEHGQRLKAERYYQFLKRQGAGLLPEWERYGLN